jgi:hypothetical protein
MGLLNLLLKDPLAFIIIAIPLMWVKPGTDPNFYV